MGPWLLSRPVPCGAVSSVSREGHSQLVPLHQGLPASDPHLLMCVSYDTSPERPPRRCLLSLLILVSAEGKEAETPPRPPIHPHFHILSKTEPQRSPCIHPSLVHRTPLTSLPLHRVRRVVLIKYDQSGNQYLCEVLKWAC